MVKFIKHVRPGTPTAEGTPYVDETPRIPIIEVGHREAVITGMRNEVQLIVRAPNSEYLLIQDCRDLKMIDIDVVGGGNTGAVEIYLDDNSVLREAIVTVASEAGDVSVTRSPKLHILNIRGASDVYLSSLPNLKTISCSGRGYLHIDGERIVKLSRNPKNYDIDNLLKTQALKERHPLIPISLLRLINNSLSRFR